MSRTATIILILVSALVFIGIGFAVGQVVQAAINTPGSTDDPLVSQSYVEQLVGQRTAALQSTIEELQGQIDALVAAQKPSTNPGTTNPGTTNPGTTTPGTTTPGTTTPGTTTPGTTTPGTTTPGTTTPSTGKVVQITGTSVNVRKGPSTGTDKIGSLVKGDEVEYLGLEGDWYKVKLSDGTVGYIANYLGVLK